MIITSDDIQARFSQILGIEVVDSTSFEALVQGYADAVAWVKEQGCLAEIQFKGHTGDSDFAGAYARWEQELRPVYETLREQCRTKICAAKAHCPDWVKRFSVFEQQAACAQSTYCPDNDGLMQQEAALIQEYQECITPKAVVWEGRELDADEAAALRNHSDEAVRRAFWLAEQTHRHRLHDVLDDLFSQLVALRNTMASRAGFESYIDFQFARMGKVDYGPELCRHYHERIRQGLPAQPHNQRRPWNTGLDQTSTYPARQYDAVEESIVEATKLFEAIGPDYGQMFTAVVESQHTDLASRPGKIPGAYCWTLQEQRKPFLFMNPTGMEHDLWTLLHEGGHAIHTLLCAHHGLPEYRDAPLEMQELAAYFFEFMGSLHLDRVYAQEDAEAALKAFDKRQDTMLAWVTLGDAFQHWVYSHPEHSPEERGAQWVRLRKAFGLEEDWSDHEDLLALEWQQIPHFFQYPLYSFEYVLAIEGARTLRERIEQHGHDSNIRLALTAGGSKSLKELWADAGLPCYKEGE